MWRRRNGWCWCRSKCNYCTSSMAITPRPHDFIASEARDKTRTANQRVKVVWLRNTHETKQNKTKIFISVRRRNARASQSDAHMCSVKIPWLNAKFFLHAVRLTLKQVHKFHKFVLMAKKWKCRGFYRSECVHTHICCGFSRCDT